MVFFQRKPHLISLRNHARARRAAIKKREVDITRIIVKAMLTILSRPRKDRRDRNKRSYAKVAALPRARKYHGAYIVCVYVEAAWAVPCTHTHTYTLQGYRIWERYIYMDTRTVYFNPRPFNPFVTKPLNVFTRFILYFFAKIKCALTNLKYVGSVSTLQYWKLIALIKS